jgi:hypothetical protein
MKFHRVEFAERSLFQVGIEAIEQTATRSKLIMVITTLPFLIALAMSITLLPWMVRGSPQLVLAFFGK